MARVVLTQPWPRVRAVETRLRALGHETLALPVTQIVELGTQPEARDALARLASFDWVVFVSPAAVEAAAAVPGLRWPASTGAALVGPGSRRALDECGLAVDPAHILHPEGPPYDAQALVATGALREPRGLRILVLRGQGGNDSWIESLRARGASVETCALYRREPCEPSPATLAALRALLAQVPAPVFVFTQADAVARVDALVAREGLAAPARASPALAIHERIAAALRLAGWNDVRCIEPGDPALGAALESRTPDLPSSHRA